MSQRFTTCHHPPKKKRLPGLHDHLVGRLQLYLRHAGAKRHAAAPGFSLRGSTESTEMIDLSGVIEDLMGLSWDCHPFLDDLFSIYGNGNQT